jgi:predicted transcriptional regulator
LDKSGSLNMAKIREHLQRLRKLVGWSQFDVAKASGICRTRVSLFENGHITLQQVEVSNICAALEKAAADRVRAITSISTAGRIAAES